MNPPEIEAIQESFPYKKIRYRNAIDLYGFSHLLRKELKFRMPRYSAGSWAHSWNGFYIPAVRSVVIGLRRDDPVVVSTYSEREDLVSKGYSRVYVAGNPFIYSKPPERVSRLANSLLVISMHSVFDQPDLKQQIIGYLEYISSLRTEYEYIYVSVHKNDLESGFLGLLSRMNLRYILGAAWDDENSLQRMRSVFDTFEFVNTNCLGSHFVYSQFCGCKLSFFGDLMEETRESFDARPKRIVESGLLTRQEVEELYVSQTRAIVRGRYEKHFVANPKLGFCDINFAQEELGLTYRSIEAVPEMLDWRIWPQCRLITRKLGEKLGLLWPYRNTMRIID